MQSRLARWETVPSQVWVRNLDLNRLPSLKNFLVYAGGVEEFRIRGLYEKAVLSVSLAYQSQDSTFISREVPQKHIRALIDGIGKSEGPRIVNLNQVPLSGVDLSPLTSNTGIRTLNLSKQVPNLMIGRHSKGCRNSRHFRLIKTA